MLTTNSPESVPSPAGSAVPSQISLDPLQQVADEGQAAEAEQIPAERRTQVGAAPLHVPSAWQVACVFPDALYPVLQEYVAVEPYVVVGALTDPFAGAAGAAPQLTRVQLGAAPLQVPLA